MAAAAEVRSKYGCCRRIDELLLVHVDERRRYLPLTLIASWIVAEYNVITHAALSLTRRRKYRLRFVTK